MTPEEELILLKSRIESLELKFALFKEHVFNFENKVKFLESVQKPEPTNPTYAY